MAISGLLSKALSKIRNISLEALFEAHIFENRQTQQAGIPGRARPGKA